MTRAEYERTRVLPERKRATRNGKRSIDSFVKSIRDRLSVESPDDLEKFDNDIAARLTTLYFYFTKYIMARWPVEGITVAAAASSASKVWYCDNLLDGYGIVVTEERLLMKHAMGIDREAV